MVLKISIARLNLVQQFQKLSSVVYDGEKHYDFGIAFWVICNWKKPWFCVFMQFLSSFANQTGKETHIIGGGFKIIFSIDKFFILSKGLKTISVFYMSGLLCVSGNCLNFLSLLKIRETYEFINFNTISDFWAIKDNEYELKFWFILGKWKITNSGF